MERRLAAILAADVVGYSRLVEIDEADALDRLRRLRAAVLDPAIARHRGRVVKVLGDGVLAEFGSAVGAMRCALEVQTGLAADPSALRLRIGVNVGDVVVEGDDLLGDGINVAARLETLAEPGGIALSAAVHEHVVGRIDAVFEDAGNCALKNIDRPVHVWRWRPEGLPRGSAETMPLALPDKPSIVVLPFDDLSGGGEHAFLADGIAEAITATLSRIRSFFVIARNSAFTYRGQATNVQEIGRALGVAYVLEGSVQRAGPRVRITVQLVETEGGSHLWAEKYDGSIEDVFDLQDRITEQVAGALQPSIRLAEIARVRRKRPQELGAYDYAMRAMPSVWVLEKEQAARALELLDAALELDPDYPLARALAAWCWAQRAVYNWVDDIDDAKSRAVRLAEQAAGDAADDPLILAILGAVHTFARHYGTARVLLDRAVTLDPNAA
ncbi:MAG: adenylate/guanylate cyclase domain-containing protein [Pseudomonadota bacterium]